MTCRAVREGLGFNSPRLHLRNTTGHVNQDVSRFARCQLCRLLAAFSLVTELEWLLRGIRPDRHDKTQAGESFGSDIEPHEHPGPHCSPGFGGRLEPSLLERALEHRFPVFSSARVHPHGRSVYFSGCGDDERVRDRSVHPDLTEPTRSSRILRALMLGFRNISRVDPRKVYQCGHGFPAGAAAHTIAN